MKDESALLEELKKLIGDENYVEVEVETLEHGKIHYKRYCSQFRPSELRRGLNDCVIICDMHEFSNAVNFIKNYDLAVFLVYMYLYIL